MKKIVRSIAALWCVVTVLCQISPVRAEAATATLIGLVVDRRSALPVSDAKITLLQGDTTLASAATASDGRFRISDISPGVYDLTIRAHGYDVSVITALAVVGARETTVNVALIQSDTSVPSTLTTIGRVTTSTNQLLAATTLTQTISMQDVTDTGQIRFTDQLGTLPAVNLSTSSSVGDDVSLNLRGLGTAETATLLDGHPVGPLGAGPSADAFDFSLGPAYGLNSVDVTYGSGAQGLYGSDTIGGAVDLITIAPTAQRQASFQQQIGGFGTLSTGITATGTFNHLGYALALGRLGEYGDFYPGPVAQSARPDNVSANSANPPGICSGNTALSPPQDVSACNLQDNTYSESQNTEQSLALGKLVYSLSPVTKVEATAYDGVQWSDSTGNGDNDYLPYNVRLGQIEGGSTDCTTSGGVAGYSVLTNPVTDTVSCYTAQQYAAATYGPDGGGAGRDRGVRLSDYHLRLTTQAGINNITVDGYADNFERWKNSSQAGGVDANGVLLGSPTYAKFYNTGGFLASDEILAGRHDVAFGLDLWHQLQTESEDDYPAPTIYPPYFFGEWSAFARDSYQINDRASAFVNAWFKHSSVTQRTTFDPRATLQIHPTHRDVFQVTYGRSDGAPSPQLLQVGAVDAPNPGASLTEPSCDGDNDVANGGNANLRPESANDFEAGYTHRFHGDSDIELVAYDTHVTNQLFQASEPVLQYGLGNITFEPGTLQTYITRLDQTCNLALNDTTVLNYLSVANTYNVASALARGIELSGRQHLTPSAYIDYSYDIESSAEVGINHDILVNNPTVINGAQLPGIPLQQASISLDVAPHPWEFRLDNYHVSANNPINRPAYWHSNAFVSRSLNNGRTLVTLGGTNIFNQAVQVWGYLGQGTVPAVNQYAPAGFAAANVSEEFGLAPAQLTLTLAQHL